MAVVIRLKRLGTKKKPHHRIVVAESSAPRDGKVIDQVGYYDPSKSPELIKIDKKKVEYWLKVGAKPTPTVRQLLKKA
jgi:small subunit ribosomal protein S16